MPQVSLNFSAASLAIAADGPRPRMNSELCFVERLGEHAIQSQAIALPKCSGKSGKCRQQRLVAGANAPRSAEAGDGGSDEGLGRRDALFGAGAGCRSRSPRRAPAASRRCW